MRERILGQPIDIISMKEAHYIVTMALANKRQLKIITLNPEMIIISRTKLEFQSAINSSDLIVPDGTGIVWGLKLRDIKDAERIPGIELAEKILDSANKLEKKLAVFGGEQLVLDGAVGYFKKNYPNIEIVASINGYEPKEKESEIAKELSSCNPDIVLVALGTPRQEIWINKYSNLFPKSIMIGIGGSLDVWSGKKQRAPIWMREKNLEWLHRVISEPKRTLRILKSLPLYVFLVLKEKFCNDS